MDRTPAEFNKMREDSYKVCDQCFNCRHFGSGVCCVGGAPAKFVEETHHCVLYQENV